LESHLDFNSKGYKNLYGDIIDYVLVTYIYRKELMIDSPLYQEILQKGKLDILTRQLSRRFGTIPPEVQLQLTSLSANQLDALSEELFDFTAVSDLAAWLQNQQ